MKRSGLIFVLVFSMACVWSAPFAGTESRFIAATPSLNMRREPNTTSKVVTTLPFNSEVTFVKEAGTEDKVNGMKGRWVEVRAGGKSGWVFGSYLSYIKLNRSLWATVESLNQLAANARTEKEVEALFIRSMDHSLLSDLGMEFESLRNKSFEEDDFSNIYYLSDKLAIMRINIAGESNDFSPNLAFFKERSPKASTAYEFFTLCEKGFIGIHGGLFGGDNIFPSWYDQESSFQGRPVLSRAKESLVKWKAILPKLKGTYRQVGENTIKALEKDAK